jgi:hypothetical protein
VLIGLRGPELGETPLAVVGAGANRVPEERYAIPEVLCT